ncbi:MAG: hypothetical protein IJV54_07930 [Bacteroidales bacterium]|nr:hypothetical protein [Bacteroidales bacterium]MBQ9712195.1 hypothetical protein [Bacteroidales bacterium]
MRRSLVILCLMLLGAALVVSCTSTLSRRFDSFVSSVEKHCESYSPDDWTKANEKFSKLFSEYKDNRSELNSEDKKAINSAILRYAKAAANSGLSEVKSYVDELLIQIPTIIEDAKTLLRDLGFTI